MAEELNNPTTTGIGQGTAQVLTAQIGSLDYRSLQRAAQSLGEGVTSIVKEIQQNKEKLEALKRAYDLKVADSGGLKFKKYQTARDAIVADMREDLINAKTQDEIASIYNERLGELALIKAEDKKYQQVYNNFDPDKATKMFTAGEDGGVQPFYQALDETLNSPISEEESSLMFSDGVGSFVDVVDTPFKNRFNYMGTPEAVGAAEVASTLQLMAQRETLPTEVLVEDGQGGIDVFRTFQKLDSNQRQLVQQQLLNPNSSFSQAYRVNSAVESGNVNVPTIMDESLGVNYYEGQKEMLDQIIGSQMAIDTKTYRSRDNKEDTDGGAGDESGLMGALPIQPTQPFVGKNNQVKSLAAVNTGSGFTVKGSDGTDYTVSGTAYDPESGMKFAVDPQGRVIAADNPELSNSLATTWESKFIADKPENKQSLTAQFENLKKVGSTVSEYTEDEALVTEFTDNLKSFSKGIEDEEALYDYLADLTGMTADQVRTSRVAGPSSKTIEERFEGVIGGESIGSEESINALKKWVLSQNPYQFLNAAGVYEQQKAKISGVQTPTASTPGVITPTTSSTVKNPFERR